MSFLTPQSPVKISQVVKKSEFIGLAFCIESRQDAITYITEIKSLYPDARHVCWAYAIGHPEQPTSAAMNDDGEPSGTAGKPIFNVISHSNIGNLLIVVVRYFGGIKLGAGGLVRAYSGCAQAAIDALTLVKHVAYTDMNIECPFEFEAPIRRSLNNLSGQVSHANYTNKVSLECRIPLDKLDELRQQYAAHGDRIEIKEIAEKAHHYPE